MECFRLEPKGSPTIQEAQGVQIEARVIEIESISDLVFVGNWSKGSFLSLRAFILMIR